MSKHALDRIQQRYGRDFTWKDLDNIIKAIKEGNCYILDAAEGDRISCLISYNHCPLKLIYCSGKNNKGHIITAMPLDIDEWNKYISQIPEIFSLRNNNKS